MCRVVKVGSGSLAKICRLRTSSLGAHNTRISRAGWPPSSRARAYLKLWAPRLRERSQFTIPENSCGSLCARELRGRRPGSRSASAPVIEYYCLQNPTLRSGHFRGGVRLTITHMHSVRRFAPQKRGGETGALLVLVVLPRCPLRRTRRGMHALWIYQASGASQAPGRKAHARANATTQRHVSPRLPCSPETSSLSPLCSERNAAPSGAGV